MIDFHAFDDTEAIRARIDLVGDRIADVLARGTPIPAFEVELVDLRTRQVHEVEPHAIDPGRLTIVVATGPRGARSRRVETAVRPVRLVIGRFTIHGFIHAPAPADPVTMAPARGWLPITEAVLEYHADGRMRRERFDTLLVNRAAALALSVIDEGTHELHWLAGAPSVIFPEEPVGA